MYAPLLALLLASPAATMRLSYTHTGTATEEHFARQAVVVEGPWAGPADRRVDETNLGKYLFELRDAATNRLLYSRGFASLFGEWETTAEARAGWGAFSESLRFPAPETRAQLIIKKRDSQNLFRELWSTLIDPRDRTIQTVKPPAGVKCWAVVENGPPAEKVDLVLVGDGYTAAEMEKWHADAKRLAAALFAVSPFKEHQRAFNIWAVDVPADESGIASPSQGIARRSPVRAAYDAFGSERYVLTFDDERLREIASAAPYEFIEIVANGRKYGGGGIFNLYATVASDNQWTPYVFVHEFGHHFAGLADEYYTSDVAYLKSDARPEPWEPNVTANPKEPKWRDLLTPGLKLPTPWAKAEFEAAQTQTQQRRRALRAENRPEQEMEELFRKELAASSALLGRTPGVGAFEGANYESTGYYRSEADCIMFTRSQHFCAACRRAIERIIALYASE
jgi:hypothetical protein